MGKDIELILVGHAVFFKDRLLFRISFSDLLQTATLHRAASHFPDRWAKSVTLRFVISTVSSRRIKFIVKKDKFRSKGLGLFYKI
jgi:hypothetical protein